jgi:D-alanyl-D-alanine carboxypeptidase
MLPSGNDAAVTLMHNFADYGIDFVNSMNGLVATLGLESTQYANPHGILISYVGLFHECNYSSAHDIGKLTYQAMQNIQFASVVRTKIYFSEIEDKFGEGKEVFWENTNKMLYNGYRGVKTGITKEAGPCVVEYYEDKDCSYIIVLLNCRSVEHRW